MYHYSITDYGQMIGNQRSEAYVQALKAAIKPGNVVVEIGTGTGFFATLACQLGAERVYAVEPNPVIAVARQVAEDNGYADKIEFVEGLSQTLELAQPADVLLSDLRGTLPLYEQHIPTIVDARQRLLRPGGVQIPQQDTLWATLVQTPEFYHDKYVAPWLEQPYGCDFSANHKYLVNNWRRARLLPEQCLVAPQVWQVLDYTTRTDPGAKATLEWEIDQPGVMHGIGTWFDGVLWKQIGFSAAPDQPELVYGQGFFPLVSPVELAPGDRVMVTLQASFVGGEYIYSWQTKVLETSGVVKVNYQQSTFLGTILTPPSGKIYSKDDRPKLNPAGQIDSLVLQAMARAETLIEIADSLAEQFPQKFANPQMALKHIYKLAQKYGEA